MGRTRPARSLEHQEWNLGAVGAGANSPGRKPRVVSGQLAQIPLGVGVSLKKMSLSSNQNLTGCKYLLGCNQHQKSAQITDAVLIHQHEVRWAHL